MKLERQTKIVQLISQNDIETQEELAERLTEEGFVVTQATISRDIRDLKLSKVATSDGRQKYAIQTSSAQNLTEKYIRVFKDGYVGLDRAGTMIVVKTLTGLAMAVAAAIDAINFEEVVGSIAGDDTIFCATRSEEDAIAVMDRMDKIANR